MVVGCGEGERVGAGVCIGVGDDADVGLLAPPQQPITTNRGSRSNNRNRVAAA